MIEKEFDCLSNIRMKKMNRQIIANLCITSISSKFDQLKIFVQGKVYIFIVTKNQSGLDLEVIVNHITLLETGTGLGFLFIFEKTYQKTSSRSRVTK